MICTWRRNASTGSSCVTTRSPSNTSSPASGIRHQQMQQEPCEGRLAAAGFADYPQGLALAHRERHAVDRLDRLPAAAFDREMLAQIAGDQQWLKRAATVAWIKSQPVTQKRSHGLHPDVHRRAQPVADQIAADRGDKNRQTRQGADQWHDIDRLAQGAQHQTPIRQWRPHAKAEKGQPRGQQNADTQPQPVKRVEIPKPDGGVRKLGVPCVVDRLIQQALLQVLQGQWDPTFSEHSYGFRPGRSAHQAVAQAQQYIAAGYNVVVDLDLEKFFDRVNHDSLMARVAARVTDKRVLKLIRAFLKAGVMEDGLVSPVDEGTPQGGPLSPLLSNLVLDDLDKELARRGHRFCRYADDCN